MFTTLKGSYFLLVFATTEAVWSSEISEDILKILKLIIGKDSFSYKSFKCFAPFG